tara:strand:- start:261 stop:401 length:141 start_codon:yes stop_codon:yes gene_type:complete
MDRDDYCWFKFVVMIGIVSGFGVFQGLINTTLKNDSNARASRKSKK